MKKTPRFWRHSLVFVPHGDSSQQCVELGHRVLAGLLVLMGVVLASAAFFAGGYTYYRHEAKKGEALNLELAQFQLQKAQLAFRMEQLEENMGRTDRFAAHLDKQVSKQQSAVAPVGPLDASEWQASLEQSSFKPVSLAWKSPLSSLSTSELLEDLNELEKKAGNLEENVHKAFMASQDQYLPWAALPTLWPARGWITGEFGDRRGMHHHGRWHEGIDIAAPIGTAIVAPADGVVVFAGYRQGYGQAVIVDHGYGMSTLYGHCSQMLVSEGAQVKRGMLIATVGNTGRSTGPHLHYEVHVDGAPVDPLLYISERI